MFINMISVYFSISPIFPMYIVPKTHVEDFETGNVEYTNEVSALEASLKGDVTLLHKPLEDTIEHGLSHGTDGVGYLLDAPTLGDELVTDLDLGLGQVPVEISTVDTEKLGNGITNLHRIRDSLTGVSVSAYISLTLSPQFPGKFKQIYNE